jgi:hypothetical protein
VEQNRSFARTVDPHTAHFARAPARVRVAMPA